MKNIFQKLLMITVVGSFAFLYSCGEDTEVLPEAPTASASADATEYEEGSTATITLDFTAPGELSAINITPTVDGVAGNTNFNAPADFGLTNTETAGSVSIEVDVNFDAGSEVKLVFDVVDKENQTASDSVTFTVVSSSPDARAYAAVLLAAPLGNLTSETFFSTNTGETYSMNEVNSTSDPISADIDFGYFYGSGSGATDATLSDPASYPIAYGQASWGTRNSTTFRRTSLDAAAFSEVVTWEDIDAAYENADAPDSDAGIESGLSAGDVLAFETDADKTGGAKKGLLLINSITPGDGENGQISLEILVQEDAE